MPSRRTLSQVGLAVALAAAAGSAGGEFVRRRRSAKSGPPAPPPPLTTQSSPGQIADLQQAYGADMGPPPTPPGDHR